MSVVEGKQALPLLRHPIDSFRVYAFRGDTVVAIPFQIDERDRRDRWALESGPHPNADQLAKEFDENDVLVFLNRDLGRQGERVRLPAGATLWTEVRIGAPAAPLGFVYIGVFAQPSPLPCIDCAGARYEEATDRVYAERYALAFHAPLPTHIGFVNQIGEFGDNVAAGVHAAGEVRFLGGLIALHKTDADIRAELLGYRNGPVRAIRRARYWIPLPFGFRTAGRVDLLFYRDFVEGTAQLKVGIPPSLILASGELRAYFAFLRQDGARVLLEDSTMGDPSAGGTASTISPLDGRPARWAALLLPDGHVVLLIVRLEGALQRLEQRFSFNNITQTESKPGGRLLFGFQFARVDRLTAGTHQLSVFACVLERVSPEDIRAVATLFLSPPEVAVSPLSH